MKISIYVYTSIVNFAIMKKQILLAVSAISFLGKDIFAQQYSWIQRANFGGGGRCGALTFAIGDKGYRHASVEARAESSRNRLLEMVIWVLLGTGLKRPRRPVDGR